MKKNVIIFLICLLAIPVFGQSSLVPAPNIVPEPIKQDEFPIFINDAIRFSIITVGIYPFTTFFTNEAFGIYKLSTNNFESQYYPWPFKSSDAYNPTQEEKYTIFAISLGSALTCAFIDWGIQVFKRSVLQE